MWTLGRRIHTIDMVLNVASEKTQQLQLWRLGDRTALHIAGPVTRGPGDAPVQLGKEHKTPLSHGEGAQTTAGRIQVTSSPRPCPVPRCKGPEPWTDWGEGLPQRSLQTAPAPCLLWEAHQPTRPSW